MYHYERDVLMASVNRGDDYSKQFLFKSTYEHPIIVLRQTWTNYESILSIYILENICFLGCIPLCSCFDGHTRDRICSACSTSSPCSPSWGAPLVRGRNCGKAHSRSGRISSDGRGRQKESTKLLYLALQSTKSQHFADVGLDIWTVKYEQKTAIYLRTPLLSVTLSILYRLFRLWERSLLPRIVLYWRRADRQVVVL